MKTRCYCLAHSHQVLVRNNGLFIQLPGQRMPALAFVTWLGPTRIQSAYLHSLQ